MQSNQFLIQILAWIGADFMVKLCHEHLLQQYFNSMPNILHPARTPELTLATAALIQMKPKTLQMLNVVDSKTHK